MLERENERIGEILEEACQQQSTEGFDTTYCPHGGNMRPSSRLGLEDLDPRPSLVV
jgi:hypothetical protein